MSSLTLTNYNSIPNSTNSKTSLNIDYNYPSLNRKDTMYLSTMTHNDFPIRKFKQLQTKRNWSINLYNLDIEGSSPRKFGAFHQKIDFINKNDDIEKSFPKKLHIKLKKPEYNLSNSDIEYSNPQCVKSKIKRHLNPLEPKYKLPKGNPFPPYEPKFIKDNINVDDIEGAKPKKVIGKLQLRDNLNINDIKDSWSKKPYIRKTKYNYIDYTDVTNTEFKTSRNTNPLDPFYVMKFIDGSNNKFGPIEKSKPHTGYPYIFKVPFNLKNDDIEGSNTGSKNKIKNFTSKNFCYDISDIKGAKSGTLLKGIYTERNTNPICPQYKYPGNEELKGYYENNPYNNINPNINTSNINRSRSMINSIKKSEEKNDDKIKDNKNNNKILDKNLKIAKNENISLGQNKKEIDLKSIPYIEDKVDFDKNKYKKPELFFPIQHDQYLIPPLETLNKTKSEALINPDMKNIKEMFREKNLFKNKNNRGDKFKTFANRLDDFMSSTNYKFNEDKNNKAVEPFIGNGIPNNFTTNNENSKTIDEIKH